MLTKKKILKLFAFFLIVTLSLSINLLSISTIYAQDTELLIDFGATDAGNTYGTEWQQAILGPQMEHTSADGHTGTQMTSANDKWDNYQGIQGSSREFKEGDVIKVTWYNNSGTTLSMSDSATQPLISFDDLDAPKDEPGEPQWYWMTPNGRSVNPGEQWESYHVVTSARTVQGNVAPTEGMHSLINISLNQAIIGVICEKIEHIPASIAQPTPPSNLQVSLNAEHPDSKVDLSWDVSQAPGGVDYYRIYRNGIFIDKTKETQYTDSLLQYSQTYTYNITAIDTVSLQLKSELHSAFNESKASQTVTIQMAPFQGRSDLIDPQNNLQYLGAFRFPDEDEGGSWWGHMKGGIGYYPFGDPTNIDGDTAYPGSIYAFGHTNHDNVSEISIPEPVISKNLDDLPKAKQLKPFQLVRPENAPNVGMKTARRLTYSPLKDKFYTIFGDNYKLSPGKSLSHGSFIPDFSSLGGLWIIGDKDSSYPNYYASVGYLFNIPQEWADQYTPNMYIMTGGSRPGAYPMGPGLIAIQPWNDDGSEPTPEAELKYKALLHYGLAYKAGKDQAMDGWMEGDGWRGGVWLNQGNKSAVVIVGGKVYGESFYGHGDGTVRGQHHYVPGIDLVSAKGMQNRSRASMMLFYDPADLAKVAQGQMEPWEPQPYAVLNLDQYMLKENQHTPSTGASLGNITYDKQRGLIYAEEIGADGPWHQPKSIVHVFKVMEAGSVNQYPLTVAKDGAGTGTVTSSPGGIDCGSSCSVNLSEGTPVTLTANPDAGSEFSGWSGEGCSGTGTCSVVMDQARNVTATFNQGTQVQCTDGDNDGYYAESGCGTAVDCNDSDANINPGAEEICGDNKDNNCSGEIDKGCEVNYSLTINTSGDGNGTVASTPEGINCGSDCSENYNEGTQVTLTALVNQGSEFTGWSGEGCSGTGICSVVMDQARNVTATFNQGTQVQCTDGDNDGYYAESGCGTAVDCNDSDANINPGVQEIPGDGIDQNCDGSDTGGNVIQAASGSAEDIQAACNNAKPGDLIRIPEGTFTFSNKSSNGVYCNAGITIQGAGQGKTRLKSTGDYKGMLRIDGSNGLPFTFSDISWEGPGGGLGLTDCKDFRIHHSTFKNMQEGAGSLGSHSAVQVKGDSQGVIDHCTFKVDMYLGGDSYGVQVIANPESWDRPLELGTADAVFVEDCYFEGNQYFKHAICSNNGGKYVFRYNTMKRTGSYGAHFIDAHGTMVPRGARSVEIYENIMLENHDRAVSIRGGDGVIFNNKFIGGIYLVNEATWGNPNCGYPCGDQTTDMYIWNNIDGEGNPITSIEVWDYGIEEGRDYFLYEKPGYTPYTYPHPLVTGTVPPSEECTESDWIYSDGDCQPDNTLTRTWTKLGTCQGGVSHPATEVISCPGSQVEYKILPLGDSITEASLGYNSYRRPLWHKLNNAGYNIDFIGNKNGVHNGLPPNPDFDMDHEGHSGWKVEQLLTNLPTWLGAYTPDIVLLHAGTNDAIAGQSTQSTVEELEDIIDVLRNDNPDVTILLAKLIPTTRYANIYIDELNEQIPAIASKKSTSQSPVIVVDQNTGFDPGADLYDSLHPNESGEEKMAQKWYDALIGVLGESECSDADWTYKDGECQPDNTLTRTWTKLGTCQGGVTHPATEIISCTYTPPEPIDGGWSKWNEWSACTASCGGGTQERTRTCDNPLPQNGGADCVGEDREVRECNTQECPVASNCGPLTETIGEVINVSNVSELKAAMSQARSAGGNKTILLADGVYELDASWQSWMAMNNLMIRSASGNRDSVIIKGEGYEGGVGFIFQLAGSNITLADMTIGEVRYHPIQIVNGSSNNLIHNLRIYNGREQLLKGSTSSGMLENTIVECCLFEFPSGQAYQSYTGGIDVHKGRNWRVRDNVFKNIRSPGGSLAEYAVHFWNSSEGTIVERNIIINSDRGIGFGLTSPHYGGIIRNNMICNDGTGVFNDVGIGLSHASGAKVYNNTIYHEHSYSSIEYRYSDTSAEIYNNLCNRSIWDRGGSANLESNVLNAQRNWFVNASAGDLHLSSPIPSVIDQGMALAEVMDDIDKESRPNGDGYDIGADEYGGSIPVTYYLLNITKDGPGGVTSSPGGIDCGSVCAAEFEENTIVTLTATPDAGSEFAGWNGDCEGTGACVVTMDAAKSVMAIFLPVTQDTDQDGIPDDSDNCPTTPNPDQTDRDGDGFGDACDECPNDPAKVEPDVCGCGVADTDTDDDGTPDCQDNCPNDPNKVEPGVCGCGVPDTDTDNDGTPDCQDNCPNDPNKVEPGVCGCGVPDTDTDNDGMPDCNDGCRADPNKVEPGVCGCGVPDTDSDNDGIPDCTDGCPADPDNDSDLDGVCGDVDNCPATLNPTQTDSDEDGLGDLCDACPKDPANDSDGDGICGDLDNCPNTPNADQIDADGDGEGDACEEPVGDVSISKEQELEFDRGRNLSIPFVYPGDMISYSISATNLFNVASTLMVSDALSALVDYVKGSLKINGDTVDDESLYFDGNLLEYTSDPLFTNQSLTISFDVLVKEDALYEGYIENFVMVTAYPLTSDIPLVSGKMSNVVQAQVKDPVPEPSTIIFFGTGLLGLFALVRRRRGKKNYSSSEK